MGIFLRILVFVYLFFMQTAFANLRDPTRPLILLEKEGPELQTSALQAIIISKGRRLAIFNGQPLYLGSELAGFKVVGIDPNTVHLEGPDGKMTLFLFNQTIKKSADQAI